MLSYLFSKLTAAKGTADPEVRPQIKHFQPEKVCCTLEMFTTINLEGYWSSLTSERLIVTMQLFKVGCKLVSKYTFLRNSHTRLAQ